MQFLQKILFVFVLLSGVFYSCKDKNPAPTACTPSSSCQPVKAAKEFFLFKPGSWWVYEEENSHVRDSMYVYSYANGSDYTFDIVIKSALDQFEYDYWPEYNGQPNDHMCSKTANISKKCMNIKRSKGITGSPGVTIGEGRCMFFQYNLYDSVPSYNNNYLGNFVHIKDILSGYQLGSYSFGETVKVYDPHDAQDKDHPTYHYYTRGIGLVRKELIDTAEIWNLVNYHIEE